MSFSTSATITEENVLNGRTIMQTYSPTECEKYCFLVFLVIKLSAIIFNLLSPESRLLIAYRLSKVSLR